jgi:AraC family transcriptional regulator
MDEPAKTRVTVSPGAVARRIKGSWSGLALETIEFGGVNAFEYGFAASEHVLIAAEHGQRSDGETVIDGLPPSTRREIGGRLCFVPAGHAFAGRFVARVFPRSNYLFLDPAGMPPELGLDRLNLVPRLFFEDAALWSTAMKLARVAEHPDPATRLYADALAMVLGVELSRLQRGAPVEETVRGGLAPWQQRTVRDFIEDNLTREISLQELAAVARLSPTHFARAFKQSLGMPPHHWQIERRIARAKILLATSDNVITAVAFATGFAYPGNFATAFRRITGLTPRDYRRATSDFAAHHQTARDQRRQARRPS